MNEITIKNGIVDLGIFEKNNDAWVSSVYLAAMFDKRHDHVLRDVKNVKEKITTQNWGANFIKSTYENRGKKYPCYLLNRKSFTLIAMGFTGEKAMEFKIKYIEAFENMINLIQTRILSKDGYKIMTDAIKRYIYNSNPYNYVREANLVNNIVLGMTAKQFKEINNVDGSTRDSVVEDKLVKLDEAQRLNAQLIKASMNYDDRNNVLNRNFKI